MKLLYITLNQVIAAYSDNYQEGDDLYDAFTKVADVHGYTNVEQAIAFDPDLVYIHSGALPKETVLEIRENTHAIWGQWTGDSRPEQLEPVMRYDFLDFHFMAGIQDIYPFKINWLPHCVADWQFKPVNDQAKGVVYIANEYHHFPGGLERYELACEVRDSIGLTWHGSATEQIFWRKTT